jgi:hypothetical protein
MGLLLGNDETTNRTREGGSIAVYSCLLTPVKTKGLRKNGTIRMNSLGWLPWPVHGAHPRPAAP